MNLKLNIFLRYLMFISLVNGFLWADISGTIFRDYNLNGTKDSLEVGVADINITAYDDNRIVSSVMTDTNGAYTLNTADDSVTKYRVEVTNLPTYLEAGTASTGFTKSLTTVVVDGTTHDVGLNNPADYAQDNPSIVTVKILKDSTDGAHKDEFTLLKYNYSDNDKDTPTPLVKFSDLGSVYGVAHSKNKNITYTASWFKRHTGVKPDGIAAIYKIDSSNVVSEFTNENGTDPRSSEDIDYDWNHDVDGYANVGKIGFGDIELSDDESQLFAVNLEDKKLYVYDLDTNGDKLATNSYFIPNPCDTEIDFRPMGLGFNDGVLYVGTTCTAESTVDPNNADESWLGIVNMSLKQ